MVAAGSEDRAADNVVRLAEFADNRFGCAAVIDEFHRPTAGHVGVAARRVVEKSICIPQSRVQRHMLVLGIRLDQKNLALQFISCGIGFEHVFVARHDDFQMRAGDLHVAQQQALRAIDKVADWTRILLLQFQAKRQLAARCLQHDTVGAHFHVGSRGCSRGRRIALMARAERQRRRQTQDQTPR